MNTFKRIRAMGVYSLLIIASLSIGLTIVNTNLQIFEKTLNRAKSFSEMVDTERTIFMGLEFLDLEKEYSGMGMYKELDDFKDEIYNLKDRGILSNVIIYSPDLELPEGIFEKLPDKYHNLSRNGNLNDPIGDCYKYNSFITINYDYLSRNKLEVVKGRTLVKEDFKKDYKKENMPMLLGNEYKDLIDIGQVFVTETPTILDEEGNVVGSETVKYEVVGILEKDEVITIKKGFSIFEGAILYTNTYGLAPVVENNFYNGYGGAIQDYGAYLEFNNLQDIASVEAELDEKLSKLKYLPYKANFESLKEEGKEVKEYFFRDFKTSVALGGSLIILSLMGSITLVMGQISKRKKEIGVKIATGAYITKLYKEILMDMIILTITSSLLSVVISYIATKGIPSLFIISVNMILALLIGSIIAVFPIKRIKAFNAVELVRGKN